MTQKHIDQEIRLPNGKVGIDAYDAFAIVNENAQDAEKRLSSLEAGGQDVEDLKVGLQQEAQLRADADAAEASARRMRTRHWVHASSVRTSSSTVTSGSGSEVRASPLLVTAQIAS